MVDFFWFSLRFRPFQVENFFENFLKKIIDERFLSAMLWQLLVILLRPKCDQGFCLVMLHFRELVLSNVMV